MGPIRIRVRTLMILVAVAAVTLALIPIALRTLYPEPYQHIFFFYVGDTVFSVQF